MSLHLTNPLGLILLLAVPAALYYGLTSFDTASGVRKRVMLAVRAIVIGAVVLDFAGLRIIVPGHEDRTCTYFLVDVSESVPDESIDEAIDYVTKAQESRESGSIAGLITFAGAPFLEERASGENSGETLADRIREARKRRSKGEEGRTNTDLEAALDLAIAAFPEGYARRVVLLSDLNETSGEASAGIQRAKDARVEADIVALSRERAPEVLLYGLALPSQVKLGESFNVHARVSASQPCPVVLSLYRNGYLVGRKGSPEEPLLIPAGVTDITLRQSLDAGGRYLYGAKLHVTDPKLPDNPDNNSVYSFTEVRGKPRVLLLGETEDELEPLANALQGSGADQAVVCCCGQSLGSLCLDE